MLIVIGSLVVIGCVVGGYTMHGGHLGILWQPSEFIIIFGAAIGALVIGNSRTILKGVLKAVGPMARGPRHNKASYVELLSLLYALFRLAKSKGDLALESHVERPSESSLFKQFPKFSSDHHNMAFLCDYLRLLTLGVNTSHEVETIIGEEIDGHHKEHHAVAGAVNAMADGMPALGIVAAVLGVINTMGSITEPPEVLGHLIGAALVGTFSGVLLSYGFFAPMARAIELAYDADTEYLHVIKTALLAHMQGYAPQVSMEFARKVTPDSTRPSFQEMEETIGKLSVG